MSEQNQHLELALDPYTPSQIAERVETAGVAKAHMATIPLLTLSVLAGAFIAFGGAFFTLAMTGGEMGLGPGRIFGGVAFSLGLILVVVGGAELFTGNNLIAMAWADKRVTFVELLRNWALVYLGNFVGSIAMAFMVHWSGTLQLGGGAVAETAVRIAEAKVQIPLLEAFFRGVLCNTLVCLALWLCFAARTIISKIFAIIFPISAFVALGFEHSVANMYLIPVGMLAADPANASISIFGFVSNLVPVTIGNVFGGSIFVALVYWIIYRRGR